MKARKLLDLLIDCSLVSKNYAPWSYFIIFLQYVLQNGTFQLNDASD
jgi:hypothetical protein